MRKLLFIGLAMVSACSKSQEIGLAGEITLLPHRPVTLRSAKPLLVVGSTNQLCLRIEPPDSLNNGPENYDWGVKRSGGVLVQVSAALLHADNSSDTISSVGYTMSSSEDCLTIGPSIYDSLHPPFVAARIVATDTLHVANVSWRSYTGW